MRAMQRSIAAKFAARPAARFVRPSARLRERRMGLRASHSLIAASSHRTVLRLLDLGPFVALRASWRAITPAGATPSASGRPRPSTAMHWTRSLRGGTDRRSRPAPAWRD